MVTMAHHLSAGFSVTTQALIPAVWLALTLDLLLGDPRKLPHPVMLIARLATTLESFFKTRNISLSMAGLLTVIITLLGVAGAMIPVFVILAKVSPLLLFVASVLVLYTTIALRSLCEHGLAVYRALPEDKKTAIDKQLGPAREKVGMIVGRDTNCLNYEGIVRACVESVAENMSDGVVAPVFYAFVGAGVSVLFGLDRWAVPAAALTAMLYKTVNTMDSLFGYKNARYVQFGRAAALLDDLVNYIPARLSAFALIMVSFIIRKSKRLSAWKIVCRDRRNHSSPNAGWPEAAMAGALDIQLGGPGSYFSKIIEKPYIGDAGTLPERHHITTALWLMLTGSFLVFILLSVSYSVFL